MGMNIPTGSVSTLSLRIDNRCRLSGDSQSPRTDRKGKPAQADNDFEQAISTQNLPEPQPPKEQETETSGTETQTRPADSPASADDTAAADLPASQELQGETADSDPARAQEQTRTDAPAQIQTELRLPQPQFIQQTAAIAFDSALVDLSADAGPQTAKPVPEQAPATSRTDPAASKVIQTNIPAQTEPSPLPWTDGEQNEGAGTATVSEPVLPKKIPEKGLPTGLGHSQPENGLTPPTGVPSGEAAVNTAQISQATPVWQNSPVNPADIIDQVRVQILQGSKSGEKKITMQLQPPELGKMSIELSLSDKQIEARIYTEHQVVREVVLSQIEQLRSQLAQEGWNLNKVDVNIGTFREQQDQTAQAALQSLRAGYRGGAAAGRDGQTESADTAQRVWQPPGLGRRVNLIV